MPTFLSKRLSIFEKIFLIKFMHEKVDGFWFYSDIDSDHLRLFQSFSILKLNFSTYILSNHLSAPKVLFYLLGV